MGVDSRACVAAGTPLRFLHYDVFTQQPLAGNPLAVFPDAGGVTADRMQAVAREMNLSESTFVLASETPGTDVRMRIFTPTTELPMAGHPTIGTTFALAHTGVIRAGTPRFVFGLEVGATPVDLAWDGVTLRFAWMTQPNPTFGPLLQDAVSSGPPDVRPAVAAAVGLDASDLAPGLPVQQVSCGVPFLMVPLRDQEAVDRAVSDSSACRRLAASTGLDLPVLLFTVLPAGSPDTVYTRMFAPTLGITEDPATGGASGPLGAYLVCHRLVSHEAARSMTSLQGAAMGRPSRIYISIASRGAEISEVKVGGEAVLVGSGEMLI